MSLLYNRNDLIAYIQSDLIPVYSGDATMLDWLQKTVTFLQSRKVDAQSRRHVTNLRNNAIRYCTDRGYWNLAFLCEVSANLLDSATLESCAVPRFVETGQP